MTKDKTDIFNAVATPSAEQWRQLYYHAVTGNEAVLTPFVPGSGTNGPRAESERRRKEENFQNFVHLVTLASQERIARFQTEMNGLEERRLKLIERIDERLRESREKLQQLRDAAPEIEFPDGTRRKVFRDFGQVRDETGALVSPDIIRAEAVSNDPKNWQKNLDLDSAIARDLAQRSRLEERGDRSKSARRRADEGKLTTNEADEMTDETAKAIAEEERLFSQPPPAPRVQRERTLQTDITPTPAFGLAASPVPAAPARTPDDHIRPQGPAVSGPAPM